jgi:hypothetical protein
MPHNVHNSNSPLAENRTEALKMKAACFSKYTRRYNPQGNTDVLAAVKTSIFHMLLTLRSSRDGCEDDECKEVHKIQTGKNCRKSDVAYP